MSVTNDELLRALLDLKDQYADLNLQTATTADAVRGLRNETNKRHVENTRELKKLHSGITVANSGVKRLEGEVRSVKADVAEMKPAVNRWRASEAFRAALLRCARRSWHWITAVVVFFAGLFVWLDGHWPKIAALLRRLAGALVILAVLALLAFRSHGG